MGSLEAACQRSKRWRGAGSRGLGDESGTLVRLLTFTFRVISKRLGDSRFAAKGL
jgi:hypothetical protein